MMLGRVRPTADPGNLEQGCQHKGGGEAGVLSRAPVEGPRQGNVALPVVRGTAGPAAGWLPVISPGNGIGG